MCILFHLSHVYLLSVISQFSRLFPLPPPCILSIMVHWFLWFTHAGSFWVQGILTINHSRIFTIQISILVALLILTYCLVPTQSVVISYATSQAEVLLLPARRLRQSSFSTVWTVERKISFLYYGIWIPIALKHLPSIADRTSRLATGRRQLL